jgi:hypothetical protein
MSRPRCLQTYVSDELAARARAAAAASGLAVSEWLRTLIVRACDNVLSAASDRTVQIKLYRQSLFAMVGVDALLAGHSDYALRERVHSAFAARCRAAGVAETTDEGGSHEA